jgi:hypothetical protein
MKNQIIMSEEDLEGKLTKAWKVVPGDLIESVLYEWMSRLEWAIEDEGECYISPH